MNVTFDLFENEHVTDLATPEFCKASTQLVTEEKMTMVKVEVDRYSITCSKSFDTVVAAIRAAVGQPDIIKFLNETRAASCFPDLERVCAAWPWPDGIYALRRIRFGFLFSSRNRPRKPKNHSFYSAQSAHHERDGQVRPRRWILCTSHNPCR